MFVARKMPSTADWPVPNRLSNRCFVNASFTATIGYASTPSAAIARLRGDMKAGADADPRQRPLGPEAIRDGAQDRHLPFGPRDLVGAGAGEADVTDVVLSRGEAHTLGEPPFKMFWTTLRSPTLRYPTLSMNGQCTRKPSRR